MPIRDRRCSRCSSFFEPAKEYYRLCGPCSAETKGMDTNTSWRRPGGPDRMHGGRSRLRDETIRRSLIFRGEESREGILAGFRDFTTEYFQQSSSLSTIFKMAGFADEWLREVGQSRKLDGLLMDFCPLFREWVHQFAGEKAMELIIEYYGLYGDEPFSLETLEHNLDLNNGMGYLTWTLDKLRAPDAARALEEIVNKMGGNILQQRAPN